jgi:LysM repeat protein
MQLQKQGWQPVNMDFELALILSKFAVLKLVTVNAIFQALTQSKGKISVFLLLVLFILPVTGIPQFKPTPVKRSNNQISINGKNYFLHEVQGGQTLFGISREYQVSEEEIIKLNPDLGKKSIFHGLVLRIPDMGTTSSTTEYKTANKNIFHTVLPKENLYSLSRQYGIKVDDIREANPEIKGGLKIGMVIRIPEEKITIVQKTAVPAEIIIKADTIVPGKEAMGNEAGLPCQVDPSPHSGDNFRMAVLLPLNIPLNDTLTYSDALKPEHFRFYEFLEGIYLAIDSMKSEGFNLTLEVFDTERNPEKIKSLIRGNLLKEADLIIGPVFPNEIEIVAPYSKANGIPMVSPFSTYDAARDNPYGFQVRNKLPQQVELAVDYLGSKYDHNIIVIGRLDEKADPEFQRFLGNLGTAISSQDPAKEAKFETIYYSETSRTFSNGNRGNVSLNSILSASLPDYFILTSENEVFITEVVNELYQLSASRNITVFGLNQWVFSAIDLVNLYNINLELYSDFEDENPFVDFSDPRVLDFCRKYNDNWNIEPSKYSFQGFDIAYYFSQALFLFGHDLHSTVPCWSIHLSDPPMLTPMNFRTNGNASGFQNNAISIIRYQRDELQRKKVN